MHTHTYANRYTAAFCLHASYAAYWWQVASFLYLFDVLMLAALIIVGPQVVCWNAHTHTQVDPHPHVHAFSLHTSYAASAGCK
jgi:hypothetical protein